MTALGGRMSAMEEVEHFARLGYTLAETAARLCVQTESLRRRLGPHRLNRPDLLARFALNAERAA